MEPTKLLAVTVVGVIALLALSLLPEMIAVEPITIPPLAVGIVTTVGSLGLLASVISILAVLTSRLVKWIDLRLEAKRKELGLPAEEN